ncbi:hypothetical protein LZP73_14455 [Shewanella sp. AS16]|nr:hypothetical protein [Shewanella sp. AS16]
MLRENISVTLDEQKVRRQVVMAFFLLLIGFTYPFFAYVLSYTSEFKLSPTFHQFSSLLIALIAYITNQLSTSAMGLLNPNSEFEPQGYYELKQKYQITVNHIDKFSLYLGVYTLIYGGVVTLYLS